MNVSNLKTVHGIRRALKHHNNVTEGRQVTINKLKQLSLHLILIRVLGMDIQPNYCELVTLAKEH